MADELTITGVAGGGDGVGRLPDGRAVFVRGAVPGDRVSVVLVEERARFAKAVVDEVRSAGPARVAPPCPLVAAGCGGCGWQHVDPSAQRELKATIVGDALRRIGRLDDIPEIDPGPALAATGFRTTVRAAVRDGVAGLRTYHGHEVVPLAEHGCLVAHPLVDGVLRSGRFGDATEVTVRAGAATGERLALVAPAVGATVVPDGVAVTGADQLRGGHRAWFHDEVGGRRWRISADSFFQTRHDGAAALAEVVAAACQPHLDAGHHRLADLYGGVGLLGGVAADAARRRGVDVTLLVVEASRSAVADARVNLEDLAGCRVVRSDVRRWRPSATDVVVADPSRHGLGAEVVDRVAAAGPRALVLVSCDAGSLGRDAGLLEAAGFRLQAVTLVDLFPQTPHVEAVTTWCGGLGTVAPAGLGARGPQRASDG